MSAQTAAAIGRLVLGLGFLSLLGAWLTQFKPFGYWNVN